MDPPCGGDLLYHSLACSSTVGYRRLHEYDDRRGRRQVRPPGWLEGLGLSFELSDGDLPQKAVGGERSSPGSPSEWSEFRLESPTGFELPTGFEPPRFGSEVGATSSTR